MSLPNKMTVTISKPTEVEISLKYMKFVIIDPNDECVAILRYINRVTDYFAKLDYGERKSHRVYSLEAKKFLERDQYSFFDM